MTEGGSAGTVGIVIIVIVAVSAFAVFGYYVAAPAGSSYPSSTRIYSTTQQPTPTCDDSQIANACPFAFPTYGVEDSRGVDFLGSVYKTKTSAAFLQMRIYPNMIRGFVAQYAGALDEDRITISQALTTRIRAAGVSSSIGYYIGIPCSQYNQLQRYGRLQTFACNSAGKVSNEELAILVFDIASFRTRDLGGGLTAIDPSSLVGLPDVIRIALPGEMMVVNPNGNYASAYIHTDITRPLKDVYPQFSYTDSGGDTSCCWVAPIMYYSPGQIQTLNSLLMANQVDKIASLLNTVPTGGFFVSYRNLLSQLVWSQT